MADSHALLVEAVCVYLLQLRTTELGDPDGPEDERWVAMVRARNAYLNDKEAAR